MLELEISPEAEDDLLDIWLYIAEDQPINADRYLDKLQTKAQTLAEFPDLGPDRPELAEGLKSFPVDRYNLYYTVTESRLILVRVLPGDRDITAIF
ncbi:type II toxin-antitoxin system RelE/ParE family toxin [Exilibacterium tricleocarpae]|uniref:Type II toxin-antitoxin system RelE/ParE family toxin n=1 Tax=Exilibacterium tricleocarpae TaxID=2591008 RepID=A0A545SL88_9GAMM|nr:type II toxin-antitoxin system RelE/ParE family toxin [Exilibacterium tricleocarpae]TQV65747.1 type II toxin-antitoxin system RelE/ParE family toxin [Exilibacterium tricleocarpae]